MSKALRADPTRTTMIQNRFYADIVRRLNALIAAHVQLLVVDDAFGLEEGKLITELAEHQAYRFMTSPQKLTAYKRWLKSQVDAKVLTTDALGEPWTGTYVESAYRKGMTRAYIDTNKLDLIQESSIFATGQEAFLRIAFMQPETLSKLELLSLRSFTELEGMTATMSQQLSRILASGIAAGESPSAIARKITQSIDAIKRTRAKMIARTEIIHAHAEGQLDAFERLGVKNVGIVAEWQTAGDEKVCEQCSPLEGLIFTIKEARGMIPRHPNCRCMFAPGSTKKHRRGQIWSKKARKQRVQESVQEEKPNASFKRAKSRSSWAGKSFV